MGRQNAYMQFAHWARMVERAGSFYPPDVIKAYEKGEIPVLVGDVLFPQGRPPAASARSSSSRARRKAT
jgi:hypothetical protein